MRIYRYGTDILPPESYTPEKLHETLQKIMTWTIKSLGVQHLVNMEVENNLSQSDRTRDSIFINLELHGGVKNEPSQES